MFLLQIYQSGNFIIMYNITKLSDFSREEKFVMYLDVNIKNSYKNLGILFRDSETSSE